MSKPARSIAVIVTCFNYERYVATAIDSVLAQTRPADEVIIVDDGSTDRTPDILGAYSDRIKLIRQANAGQTEAFRTGFAASSAEIVQLLDADDRLLPDALAMVEAAWTEDTSKVQFDLEIIDGEGARLGRRFCNFPVGYDEQMVAESFERTATYRWPVTSGNAYARRLLGEGLATEIPISADGVLNTLAPLFGTVRTIMRPLGEYRLHGRNKSHDGAFGSVAVPLFANRISHRRREVAILRKYAERTGRDLVKIDILDHEIVFVNYRLIAKRLELRHDTIAADRIAHLWRRGVTLGWRSGNGLRHRLLHVTWFTVIAIAPAALVSKLVALRFGRSDLTKKLRGKPFWRT